ncbi:MAG: DNA recombination protein RmuC, partial [Gammaproteobacteria bacterium]
MDGISLLIGIILGAALGAVIGWFIAKSKFQNPGEKSQDDMREIIGLKEELARKNEQMIALSEKLDFQKQEVADLQKQFKIEFENLANKILEEKTQKFTEQNKTNLDIVLNPLKEKIEKFEKSVEEKYVNEAKGRSALSEQIKQLSDLNKQMTEEASNLTKALKGDSKTQGDWGEIQLEIILEKAGLTKDVHFSTQATFRDDDGNLKKPDFIIHLPEDKCLVIDSKVSLTAYEAFMSSEDEDERAVQLKAHMHSLRDHIKELSAKNYQQLHQINTPEHVLMYIPIEPAFILAVQESNNLFLEAFDRNVIL